MDEDVVEAAEIQAQISALLSYVLDGGLFGGNPKETWSKWRSPNGMAIFKHAI